MVAGYGAWLRFIVSTLTAMNLHAEIMIINSVAITGWLLIGWIGAMFFALRWGVQIWYRRQSGQTRLPTAFWWMSLVGAFMTLAYFTFGNPDSVGFIQNALPMALAIWNLSMDHRQRHMTHS